MKAATSRIAARSRRVLAIKDLGVVLQWRYSGVTAVSNTKMIVELLCESGYGHPHASRKSRPHKIPNQTDRADRRKLDSIEKANKWPAADRMQTERRQLYQQYLVSKGSAKPWCRW
jgi:tRNA(Phe) wybutosine-synthesizing methylase Tyw3